MFNAIEQLSRIFVTQGVRSQTLEGQLVFVLDGCGCSRASFRLFQDGFIVVLTGEFGFDALPKRRAALCEFCNWANYSLLPYGNLEMNPQDGAVQFRQAFMLSTENSVTDAQLRWFVASAAETVAILSYPLAQITFTSLDVTAAVEQAKELLSPASAVQKN
jgi:hypothetical protein